jgi:hypothetical protein
MILLVIEMTLTWSASSSNSFWMERVRSDVELVKSTNIVFPGRVFTFFDWFFRERKCLSLPSCFALAFRTVVFPVPNSEVKRTRCGLKWIEMDWNGLKWIEMDWNGLKWIEINWNELKWIEMDWNGLKWIEKDWNGLKWIEMDRNGLKWIEMDWNGLKKNEMDWNGLIWIEMDWNGGKYFKPCLTTLNPVRWGYWSL